MFSTKTAFKEVDKVRQVVKTEEGKAIVDLLVLVLRGVLQVRKMSHAIMKELKIPDFEARQESKEE